VLVVVGSEAFSKFMSEDLMERAASEEKRMYMWWRGRIICRCMMERSTSGRSVSSWVASFRVSLLVDRADVELWYVAYIEILPQPS